MGTLSSALSVTPTQPGSTSASSGAYRPTEWGKTALWSITVPSTSAPPIPSQSGGLGADPNVPGSGLEATPAAGGFQGQPAKLLVFDAVLKAEHRRILRRTEHPIQASPSSPVTSITDHAYPLPATVSLEIGMSDAMDSYAAGMWTSNASKSISCYQTLVALQLARTLVTLTTRLETYSSMLVESIAPSDTSHTLHGLRATITFSQVNLADATAVASGLVANPSDPAPTSARPQTTDSTPSGTTQPTAVPDSMTSQNYVATPNPGVPGAGDWTSS
jgi:hypothetical protein